MRRVLPSGVLGMVGVAAVGVGCGGLADTSNPRHTYENGGTGGTLPTMSVAGAGGTRSAAAGAVTIGGNAGDDAAGDGGGGARSCNDDEPDDPASATGCDCLPEVDGNQWDVISVYGHAGILGDVAYTIWGYAAGMRGMNGFDLLTPSQFGKGTRSGVAATGLLAWTNMPAAVDGQTYMRGTAQLDIRIETNDAQATITCTDETAWGWFLFTRHSNHIVQGNYALDCPASDIRVRGCFRFPG